MDFGPDPEHKIRNFILPGSFYNALTRVREGEKVFLRSFEKSYILANEKLEEKINAMIRYNPYQFKKIYNNEQIFIDEQDEIKTGYLNIIGLMDGNHAAYLNQDRNILNLHILILSETKLDKNISNHQIEETLDNWNILQRRDAVDGIKHMGLLMLCPKISKTRNVLKNLRHQKKMRDNQLQIQGFTVSFLNEINIGFVYCRSTPSVTEINAIAKSYEDCNVLMGDLNLCTRNVSSKES